MHRRSAHTDHARDALPRRGQSFRHPSQPSADSNFEAITGPESDFVVRRINGCDAKPITSEISVEPLDTCDTTARGCVLPCHRTRIEPPPVQRVSTLLIIQTPPANTAQRINLCFQCVGFSSNFTASTAATSAPCGQPHPQLLTPVPSMDPTGYPSLDHSPPPARSARTSQGTQTAPPPASQEMSTETEMVEQEEPEEEPEAQPEAAVTIEGEFNWDTS